MNTHIGSRSTGATIRNATTKYVAAFGVALGIGGLGLLAGAVTTAGDVHNYAGSYPADPTWPAPPAWGSYPADSSFPADASFPADSSWPGQSSNPCCSR